MPTIEVSEATLSVLERVTKRAGQSQEFVLEDTLRRTEAKQLKMLKPPSVEQRQNAARQMPPIEKDLAQHIALTTFQLTRCIDAELLPLLRKELPSVDFKAYLRRINRTMEDVYRQLGQPMEKMYPEIKDEIERTEEQHKGIFANSLIGICSMCACRFKQSQAEE